MGKGTGAEDGTTYVAKNGYHYTKANGKYRLTHHLIAEQILGRPLQPKERVKFVDGDRTNFDPSNISASPQAKKSTRARIAALEAQRDEIDAELDELREELESSS
jgi:hypothetical protein